MPRLPDSGDYGARPSLQTGRLDRPSSGGVAMAEGLSHAANLFSQELQKRQQKSDALNYALARNEILAGDMASQESLTENADWRKHDELYTATFTQMAEAVSRKYKLDPNDMAILQSESNLIRARGRISVGANAKKFEISEGLANLDASIATARENVLRAAPGQRVHLLQGVIEAIGAAQEKGYMQATEAEALRQATTQDFAMGVIDTMPAGERVAALEASQAHRRGYGVANGEYGPLIKAMAEEYGLPVNLLAKQMMRESSGDPNAVSPRDAVGLMQLRPITAKEMGVTDRTDPEQNVRAGAAYMRKNLDRFDGDPAAALAAFNWGPTNVRNAMNADGENWLESAPTETKEYVAALVPYFDGTATPPAEYTATNSGIGPMTAEQIASGDGSGSIADFLPSDTVAKLLKAAYSEDKTNRERTSAFSVFDAARTVYPEDFDAQMKYIKDNSKGSIRNIAEEEARQVNQDRVIVKAQRSQLVFDTYDQKFNESSPDAPFRFNQIPPEELSKMEPRHVRALKERSTSLAKSEQWAEFTQYWEPEDGGMSMDRWKKMPAYGDGSRLEADLNSAEYRTAFAQQEWDLLQREQEALKALESNNVEIPNVRPHIEDVITAAGIKFNNKEEEDQVMARFELNLRAEVAVRQANIRPPRKLTQVEIDQVVSDMLQNKEHKNPVSHSWWQLHKYVQDDPQVSVHIMDPAQLRAAYVEPDRLESESFEYGGQMLSLKEHLWALARAEGLDPAEIDDMDYQRAAFAMTRNLGDDEILLRLKGD